MDYLLLLNKHKERTDVELLNTFITNNTIVNKINVAQFGLISSVTEKLFVVSHVFGYFI